VPLHGLFKVKVKTKSHTNPQARFCMNSQTCISIYCNWISGSQECIGIIEIKFSVLFMWSRDKQIRAVQKTWKKNPVRFLQQYLQTVYK